VQGNNAKGSCGVSKGREGTSKVRIQAGRGGMVETKKEPNGNQRWKTPAVVPKRKEERSPEKDRAGGEEGKQVTSSNATTRGTRKPIWVEGDPNTERTETATDSV